MQGVKGTTTLLPAKVCSICGRSFQLSGRYGYREWAERSTCSNACGHVKKSLAKRAQLAERFWRQVDRRGPDECWLWLGAQYPYGYGVIRVYPQRNVRAHRLALELSGVVVPQDLEVCHSCDNPPCCNPRHLWVGTHTENMRDARNKGRIVLPSELRKGFKRTERGNYVQT